MGQGITKDWIHGFLERGSFVRLSENQFWLQRGPFQTMESPVDLQKEPEFSIGYMHFYDTHMNFKQGSEPAVIVSKAELQKTLESWLPKDFHKISRTDFTAPRIEQFEKSLQIILGKIQRGEIDKAVPMVFAESERVPTANDRAHWILNLMDTPQSLYPFGYWTKEMGFIGATPEILFHRINGLIRTMALAGTCPKSELQQRKPLLNDAKEMHEHNLVVEDIRKQLSQFGWVKIGETKVLELPTLLHLMTELQVEGQPQLIQDIVQKMHPTAALGVAPRNYGYQWLKELPGQENRNILGGPVVFRISEQEALCLVAIRTMQWSEAGTQLGAGCGVVKDSHIEREWQEILQKLNSVYLLMGL